MNAPPRGATPTAMWANAHDDEALASRLDTLRKHLRTFSPDERDALLAEASRRLRRERNRGRAGA